MSTVISVENVSKAYRLGLIGGGTLHEDLTRWWARVRRKPDPFLKIGQEDHGNRQGETLWALRDVSFEVKQGEVLGIIGRNGAGKSTLLKILSQITAPTSGRIRVKGRVASLLEVGTGFHPELTGRENIYLNGAILGMTKAEVTRKLDEIVDFAEVERFIDTPVKRYSSGMYVRLAFAVAAHLEPEILVVDEVLAVGDAAFQRKCLGKMSDVAIGGRTVLFVSHNMSAVNQLCQRAVWLASGRTELVGSTTSVVQGYLSSANDQIAERFWNWPGDAPGDDRVRLLAVRFLQGGNVSSVVDINAPSQIEIEFAALREVRNLVTGASLYSADGTCLFNSCDWRPNCLRPGLYRKQVCLPAPLLPDGVTRVLVQLVFFDPDVKSAVVPDALTVRAVDSDHPLSVRGAYRGNWPGAVRIHLPWAVAQEIGRSGRPDIGQTLARANA